MSEPLSPQCHECFRPLSFGSAALEFFDGLTGGYPDPDHPERTQVRYACGECEASSAYLVSLAQLHREGLDGPNGWVAHILRKRWFRYPLQWDLVTAHELAGNLKVIRDTQPMRSVVASIPRRRPPTPNNPRAISSRLRALVLERDAFKCRRCGSGASHARLVVDHIVPVAKGGTADFDNLQTLCDPCNAGKSDRAPTPHDMRTGASL